MNAKEIEQKILQLFKEINNLKIVLKTTNEKIDFLTRPKLKKSGRPKKYATPAEAYEARLKQTRDSQKRQREQREAYDKQRILKELEKQEQKNENEKLKVKTWTSSNDSEF
jgi:cell division protein FtsN